MLYSYEIEKTDKGFVGYVEDLGFETKPQTSEDDVEFVLTECLSAFVETMYRAKVKKIPLPTTSCDGKLALYVPIKLQLRILLWNTMKDQCVKQTELAEKLGVSKAMINQMVNGRGAISSEKYEEVLQVLGKYPKVSI